VVRRRLTQQRRATAPLAKPLRISRLQGRSNADTAALLGALARGPVVSGGISSWPHIPNGPNGTLHTQVGHVGVAARGLRHLAIGAALRW
jgi:hypothetical protein